MTMDPKALQAYKTFRAQLDEALQHERNAWFALVEGYRAGADAAAMGTLKKEQHSYMTLTTRLLSEMDQLARNYFV